MILTINISLSQWPATIDNSIFVIMFIYGICFDCHPYGDKVYATMVMTPVHIPVRVLNIKSDLLYVSEFTVDAWYPLPPYHVVHTS